MSRQQWHVHWGRFHRVRRRLRQRLLEPLLVGRPTLRDVVMRALAARGHLVLCELGGVRFFVDPADRTVGAWLIWHDGWQRGEFDRAVAILSAAERLRADALFVDVGAHIGTHTVYAMRTGRFARALAFEPEPANVRLLTMNLEANGLAQRTLVVAKAAGAQSGTALLHLHPRNKGAHAIGFAPALDSFDCLNVEVVRVEEALRELGVSAGAIGLIWIDVEGYEPQVFDGLGEILASSVPIAFEFTPHRYDAETKQRLVARIAAHYSHLHNLSDPPSGALPVSALASIDQLVDVLVY